MTHPVLDAFDRQVAWCAQPSPFSARVLARTRAWLAGASSADASADEGSLPEACRRAIHSLRGLVPKLERAVAPAGPRVDRKTKTRTPRNSRNNNRLNKKRNKSLSLNFVNFNQQS